MHTKAHDSYIQSVIKTTSHTTLQGSTEQDHKDSVNTHFTSLHYTTLAIAELTINQLANIYVFM